MKRIVLIESTALLVSACNRGNGDATDEHYHAHQCGRIDDRGYEIDEAEVVYWGRCPDCVERSRASSAANRPAAARPGQRRTAHAKRTTNPPTIRKSIQRSHNRRGRSSRG